MRFSMRMWCMMLAVVAIAMPASFAKAQAPGQVPAGYAYYDDEAEAASAADVGAALAGSCGCESGACDGACGGACSGDCGAGCTGLGTPFTQRPGQVFFGAEWISVRGNVSDGTAVLQRDIANQVDTFVPFDFNYDSNYRFFGGYRFADCGGELLLSYKRLGSDATVNCTADANTQCVGPFEVIAVAAGSTVSTRIDIDAQVYDVDFARMLPLGSSLGDCSCCWCPAWDIQWFFGARYADVDWVRDMATTDGAAQSQSARTSMDFDGGGPRIGLSGRRYFGRGGTVSVFARGDISVLLGDVEYVSQAVTATPGLTPTQRAAFTRVIPVTEIEIGASLHLSNNATISAGYMFSAWHDLGLGDQEFGGLTQFVYDDANILGFDGVFVRGEVGF